MKSELGTEITLDGELKDLMSMGKQLSPEQTIQIKKLMDAGKRSDTDFLLAFHDVYDAVSFALTFQNELMDLEWPEAILSSETGAAATEVVAITPAEKDSRIRVRTIATADEAGLGGIGNSSRSRGAIGSGRGRGAGAWDNRRRSSDNGGAHDDARLLLTSFSGLRVKMGVHMGSDEGGACVRACVNACVSE